MKRTALTSMTVILYLCLPVLLCCLPGCKKVDLTGRWKLTLKWDERSVFSGPPPAPTVVIIRLEKGVIFHGDEVVGSYQSKSAGRVKLKLKKRTIILHGALDAKEIITGDISYYPASEIYGTFECHRFNDSNSS